MIHLANSPQSYETELNSIREKVTGNQGIVSSLSGGIAGIRGGSQPDAIIISQPERAIGIVDTRQGPILFLEENGQCLYAAASRYAPTATRTKDILAILDKALESGAGFRESLDGKLPMRELSPSEASVDMFRMRVEDAKYCVIQTGNAHDFIERLQALPTAPKDLAFAALYSTVPGSSVEITQVAISKIIAPTFSVYENPSFSAENWSLGKGEKIQQIGKAIIDGKLPVNTPAHLLGSDEPIGLIDCNGAGYVVYPGGNHRVAALLAIETYSPGQTVCAKVRHRELREGVTERIRDFTQEQIDRIYKLSQDDLSSYSF